MNKTTKHTQTKTNENFNPLSFLMSLGAGGLAIGFWIYLNYGLQHGKGLVTTTQIHQLAQTLSQKILYTTLETMAIIFATIHIITLIHFLKKYYHWKKTQNYTNFIQNPLKNNTIMTLFLALDMTFNLAFALGNHFILQNGIWFQKIMLPALLAWTIFYIFAMKTSLQILKTSLTTKFDTTKIHFGFMIHPFTLAMIAVTGNGISAFSKNPLIANTAFFLALIPLLLAILLTTIKFITSIHNHIKNGTPERNLIPSTFIIMPTIMLIFLSFFRIGHYFDHILNITFQKSYYILATTIPFAFMTWYAIFGLTLTKNYYKTFKQYNITQWGFICPLVAYIVIGTITNKIWLNTNPILSAILITFTFTTATIYLYLLKQHINSLNK